MPKGAVSPKRCPLEHVLLSASPAPRPVSGSEAAVPSHTRPLADSRGGSHPEAPTGKAGEKARTAQQSLKREAQAHHAARAPT